MYMNNVNSEVYTDISVIIGMMPEKLRAKISDEFIYFVEVKKDKNYTSNINPKVPLKKQNIRKETKEVMAIIYREYLCSASKREQLMAEEEEELRDAEETKLGFDPKQIFVKDGEEFKVEALEVNALTVKEDAGYITRIINKIKKLFKK